LVINSKSLIWTSIPNRFITCRQWWASAKFSWLWTMLSTYYRQPMQINRASKEPINIKKPSIYVSGGIQPDVLKDLAKDSRAENGFLSRIMFAYPDEDEKKFYSNKKLSVETLNNYHKYLTIFTVLHF